MYDFRQGGREKRRNSCHIYPSRGFHSTLGTKPTSCLFQRDCGDNLRCVACNAGDERTFFMASRSNFAALAR